METIAERLRAARLSRGLDQLQLAAAVNMHGPGISMIEKPQDGVIRNLTTAQVIAISEELKVSTDWLLKGTGKGPRGLKS